MINIDFQNNREILIKFLKERPKSFYFLLGLLLLITIGVVDSLAALSVFYLIKSTKSACKIITAVRSIGADYFFLNQIGTSSLFVALAGACSLRK